MFANLEQLINFSHKYLKGKEEMSSFRQILTGLFSPEIGVR